MSSDESEHLDDANIVQQWGFQVIKDAQIEWETNRNCPPILLDRESRILIWHSCTRLEVLEFGVPGQACRITEIFLAKKIREYRATNPDHDTLLEHRRRLLISFPVVMAGSIIIATHLYHETKTITDDVALNCLMNIGLTTYTVEQIESTRLEIMNYDALDRLMPLWTTTEVAKILADYVDMPTFTLPLIEIFAHVGEFMRYQINEDLRNSCIAGYFGNERVLAVDLAAASVYAATQHFHCATPTTLPRLLGPTYAPNTYIICISNYIIYYAENEGFM